MVLQGNRLEDLRDLLTSVMQRWPLPPLMPEVLLVQSNGMKHWLELSLAQTPGLDICAATRIELPSAYLWQVYRAVLGDEAVPSHMPFDKSALQWRLMRLLPALAGQGGVYAHLQRYLAGDRDGRRRFQLAAQVADVFDGYQSYRADWLADWAAGLDQLGKQPLPAADLWQAQLWRDMRADVLAHGDSARAEASRANVHQRFLAALQASVQAGERPVGVPPRIMVFGISSLPMQAVQALAALGQVCQVMLLVQNPCQFHWGHVVEGRELLQRLRCQRQPLRPGGVDPTTALDPALLHHEAHPLLASWGKQGRDYLHLLDESDQPERYRAALQRIDVFHDPAQAQPEGRSPNRLQRLQSDILHLQPWPEQPQPVPVDDSITLICTHSAQREVEVLHDQLLAWFDADASLQPSDVMVMVPDMAAFAPAIASVLGRFARGESRHVPFSVADTSRREHPLVRALDRLLQLPQSRLTLSDWLDLFEVEAVRARFELDSADVEQLHTWLADAGVRWGLDAAHRTAWHMDPATPGLDFNSWAFGVRRMLLGYASGSGAAWHEVLPLASVGGLSAALVGKLVQWLDAMSATLEQLVREQTPAQWGETLLALLERFFKPASEAEERVLLSLQDQLLQWQQACADAALADALPLVVVREHWLAQMEAPALHQRFFGGGVQFATLMPMRSIPFRVVCLLGMNDGAYPRQTAPRDFDLMAQTWRPGDRSRREDDRYLFLEALLSARDRLYISWQGRRATDNAALVPSVLVAQLMDCMKACWQHPPQPTLQPLQPFSRRYFEAGSGLSTYAADWQRAQGADVDAAAPEASASEATDAPPPMPDELPLAELQRLLRHPVEVFYRTRLGLSIDEPQALDEDSEPFALNALELHQLGSELLVASDLEQALAQLPLSGRLPLAQMGQRSRATLQDQVQRVLQRREPWQQSHDQPLEPQVVDLQVDGVRISGGLHGLRQGPSGWLLLGLRPGAVVRGGKKSPEARGDSLVRLWVEHVAGCAMGWPLTSRLLGVNGELTLPPLGQAPALAMLRGWLGVYRAALAAPLPVSCKSAWAYLQTLRKTHSEDEALEQARKLFEDAHQFQGEHSGSAYLRRAFDDFDPLRTGLPAWASVLYGDLMDSVQIRSDEHSGTATAEADS